jgi:hypothetical protein
MTMTDTKLIAEFEAILDKSYLYACKKVLLIEENMQFEKLNYDKEISEFIVEFINSWSSYGNKIKEQLPENTFKDEVLVELDKEVKIEITAMIKKCNQELPTHFPRIKRRLARKLTQKVKEFLP